MPLAKLPHCIPQVFECGGLDWLPVCLLVHDYILSGQARSQAWANQGSAWAAQGTARVAWLAEKNNFIATFRVLLIYGWIGPVS